MTRSLGMGPGRAAPPLGALVAALVAAGACRTAPRQAAWEREPLNPSATRTSSAAAQLRSREAEALFARRDERAPLEQAIARWEVIVAQEPSNAAALVDLARAYDFLARVHLGLEDEASEDRELATYEKGVNAAERALLLEQPDFEKAMRAGEEFKEAIARIDVAGARAAYWYCVNLSRFAAKKGLSVRLFYKDRIEAAMRRVRELDPNLDHAGPDRALGALYAALPSIAGKDLTQAEKHFAAAEAAAPDFLETRLVKASYLALELDDRALYERLLKDVLAAPAGEDPDSAPENRAAQRIARKMLAEIDYKF